MHTVALELAGVFNSRSASDSRPDPIRVLVVDDNPEDARIVAILLEGGPYSCATVTSYDQGLDLIRQQAHDAYLIDYRLGDRTGLELIQEISDAASGPLILLTGLDDPALDGLALAAGASDYLSKNRLTFDDVTRSIRYSVETWRARRAAEIDRERFRALYEGVPIGIGRLSTQGVFTEANQFLTDLFRYPAGQTLIGTSVADLFDDPVDVVLLLASASQRDQPLPFEVKVKARDNTTLWIGGVLRASRRDNGELTGFEGAIGDVTARKQAEERVSIQNAILDQVRSGVIGVDMLGAISYWNRYAQVLYGWTAPEVLGKSLENIIEPADTPGVTAEMLRVTEETGHWSGEFEARQKDGSTIPTLVATSMVFDANGTPIGSVGISTDMSERVAGERALRESQELFKEMFESSPVAKSLFEVPSGRLVSVNRAMAEFLGYPIEHFAGVNRLDFTHPDDMATELSLFGKLIAGEISNYEIEKHYDRADGTVRWGLVRISLIGHPRDGLGLGMAHIIDITARKAAEAEIMFQASLLGQVHNAVIATDLSGTVTYWNHFAEQLFGWSTDVVLGRNISDATGPQRDPAVAAEVAAALISAGKWEGEVVLFKKDGSSFPAWSSDALLRDQQGDPIGVVGIRIDLTQQKQSQAEAQRQGELARSVLGALPYPQILVSFNGMILGINQAGVALIQPYASLGDSGGIGLDYLDLARRLGPKGLADGLESVLNGTATIFKLNYSVTSDGATGWFRIEVNPVAGTGAVVARWNITDEHNARGALEDLIRAKDEFIASVSHELRTPLTAVVGLTYELSEGRVTTEEIPELQTLIAQQAQEVSDIVEDLLVAARASADTIVVRPSPFYIRSQVELVVKPWLRGDPNSIDVTAVSADLVCRGDAGRVRQIMRNLVANAVRYGGKPVSIEARTDGATVTVTVQDHGSGIPPEAVERMFEPYARLGGSTGLPSSVGLGLYVSRLLARMMEGDLQYQRVDGVTCFSLTLPAERRKELMAAIHAEPVDRTGNPPGGRFPPKR